VKTNYIYQGDALEVLKTFPDESVNCCITSPPYFGLRSYGTDDIEWPDGWSGSLGLEPDPSMFIKHLMMIFREVRRVLKRDGSIWIVISDSYCSSSGGARQQNGLVGSGRKRGREKICRSTSFRSDTIKVKDMIGIPWMLAFALRDDGWWLRSDIVWEKKNCMPESMSDRPTRSYEHIFLLAKSAQYYYDADAIREPCTPENIARAKRGRSNNHKYVNGAPGQTANTVMSDMTKSCHPNGKNKRDVWSVSTKPCSEDHYATFPPDLIAPCVLAGCPENGIVLDPFIGSGTTGLVAKNHNRRYVGIELNPEYIKMAEKRLSQFTIFEVMYP